MTKSDQLLGARPAHDRQQIDHPGFDFIRQIEQLEPGDGLVRLGEEVQETPIDLEVGAQIGPEKGKEFE